MNFFRKLAAGDFDLVATAWLLGVLVIFITNEITRHVPLEIAFLILCAFLIYLFFWVPGIWRAADRYDGRFSWAPIASKIYSILVVCFALFSTFSVLAMVV